MKIWFEDNDRTGPAAEATSARNCLRAAVFTWIVFLALWYSGINILKLIGGFVLIAAIFYTAKAIFHVTTIAVLTVRKSLRAPLQIVIVIAAALLPLPYFLVTERSVGDIILLGLDWWLVLPIIIIGYVSCTAGEYFKPLIPLRSYLIAAGVVAAFCWITSVGVIFSTGDMDSDYAYTLAEEGPLSDRERALRNYVVYIVTAFAGLTIGMWEYWKDTWKG